MAKTAFDLAMESLYSDPNMAPHTGEYTPVGGNCVEVRVLQTIADPVLDLSGTLTASRKAIYLSLLQVDVPAKPGQGDKLIYDGITYRINYAEDPDALGYEWRLDVQPEGT